MLYDGDIFEHEGKTFRFRTEWDDTGDAPWEREDGHGPVSEWTTRDKQPGEMVLCSDHGQKRFYDFAEAVRIARRDGWNAAPYSDDETPGQRAHKAAMADFKRLSDWCNDRWSYVGVIVEWVKETEAFIEVLDSASLWGIESDARDYFTEVALDLADEILASVPHLTFPSNVNASAIASEHALEVSQIETEAMRLATKNA